MEGHFLAEFVADLGEQKFKAEPWFNPAGDCVHYKLANEAVVSERVDGVLSIYHSAVDGRVIGFQVKDVTALMRKHGLGVAVAMKEEGGQLVGVKYILLAAYDSERKTLRRREAYTKALDTAPAAKVKLAAATFE